MKNIALETIYREATILLDGTDNHEYARGVCELLAGVDGREDVDTGTRCVEIARTLRVLETTIQKFYSPLNICVLENGISYELTAEQADNMRNAIYYCTECHFFHAKDPDEFTNLIEKL